MQVYVPTGTLDHRQSQLAPRPSSLDGKVIGFLDNSKWNGNKLLREVERLLRDRYTIKDTVWAKKDSFSSPAPGEMIADMAARCHVIITAIGD